jgi:hypothetical protein
MLGTSGCLALFGAIHNEGVELSVSHAIAGGWTAYANCSSPALPELLNPVGDPNRPLSATATPAPSLARRSAGTGWVGG